MTYWNIKVCTVHTTGTIFSWHIRMYVWVIYKAKFMFSEIDIYLDYKQIDIYVYMFGY